MDLLHGAVRPVRARVFAAGPDANTTRECVAKGILLKQTDLYITFGIELARKWAGLIPPIMNIN